MTNGKHVAKGLLPKALAKRSAPDTQGSDLLLRFFQSHFFNEWIAIQYLYQSTQSGVHDYLCNKLYELSESQLDSYLLQLVYLAVSKPGGQLEKTVVELCSRSFKIALKVFWLLLALVQDCVPGEKSKLRHLEGLKEQVERAALEGKYDVPFRNPRLDPLSPFMSPLTSGMMSPSYQPPPPHGDAIVALGSSPTADCFASPTPSPAAVLANMIGCPQGGGRADGWLTAASGVSVGGTSPSAPGLQIDLNCLAQPEARGMSIEAVGGPPSATGRQGGGAPARGAGSSGGGGGGAQPVTSPFQQPAASVGPGSLAAAGAAGTPSGNHYYSKIRQQLGNGEGVTGLLERSRAGPVVASEDDHPMPVAGAGSGAANCFSDDEGAGGGLMSPTARLRRDTFGATLDFIEALCDASSSLTNISQEERQRALRNGLECINYEIEAAARKNVAIWFPMGAHNERVLRVTAKESVLLNSRDKAPFMLFVEVLQTEDGQQQPTQQPQPQASRGLSNAASQGLPVASHVGQTADALAGECEAVARASEVGVQGAAAGGGQAAGMGGGAGVLAAHDVQAMVAGFDAGGVGGGEAGGATGSGSGGHADSEPGAPKSTASQLEESVAVLLSSISQGLSSAFGTGEAAAAASAAVAVARSAASASSGPTSGGAAGGSGATPLGTALTGDRRTLSELAAQAGGAEADRSGSLLGVSTSVPAALVITQREASGSSSAASGATTVTHGGCAPTTTTSAFPAGPMIIPQRRQSHADLVSLGGAGRDRSSPARSAGSSVAMAQQVVVEDTDAGTEEAQEVGACAAAAVLPAIASAAAAAASASSPAPPATPQPSGSGSGGPAAAASVVAGVAAPAVATRRSLGSSGGGAAVSVVRSFCFTNEPAGGTTSPISEDEGAGGAVFRPAAAGTAAVAAAVGPSTAKPPRAPPLLSSSTAAAAPMFSSARASESSGAPVPSPPLPCAPPPPLLGAGSLATSSAVSVGMGALHGSEAALLDELVASGCLSPPRADLPRSELQRRMAHALASLRGEEPIVRLRINVLPDPASASSSAKPSKGSKAASREPYAGSGSGGGSGGGAPAGGSDGDPSTSSTSSHHHHHNYQHQLPPIPPTPPTALKTMLSKLGLCAKPPDVAGDSPPAQGAPHASARGGGAGSFGVPLAYTGPRLVSVSFEVAGGVDLRIASPHRSHRRTPSVEALSLIANKYKVKSIPPAVESGPPMTLPFAGSSNTLYEDECSDFSDDGEDGVVGGMLGSRARDGGGRGIGNGEDSPPGGLFGAYLSGGCSDLASSPQSYVADFPEGTPSSVGYQGQAQGAGFTRAVSGGSPRERIEAFREANSGEGGGGMGAGLPRRRMPPGLLLQQQQQQQQQAQFERRSGSGGGAGGAEGGDEPAGTSPSSRLHGGSPSGHAQQGSGAAGRRRHTSHQPHHQDQGPSQQQQQQQPSVHPPPQADPAVEKRRREAMGVYGERWAQRVKRVQRESPQGRRPGWALRCVIVKNGDDCRQEHLALQLVRTFQEIFAECGLPLWARHYDVLVTSNRTALIELIPDSLSIHTIKHRSPPGSTFSDHFFNKFVRGTKECVAAQRRLTESLAAYSIITYLLQIKDRHNGNVLVDDEGRLIHIDFGFMLSNSPGGVNFESAPFKLTRELLEVMDSNSDGKPSELFDYYKVLLIQGFLACRKHSDRIVLMVKMMSKSGLPCFKAGAERTVKALEKRLALNLTEVQIVQMVLSLISDSLDAWRTRQYDYYQRVMNGIL